MAGWRPHLVHRSASRRTTWTLRVAVVLGAVLVVAATRGLWVPQIGRSLVCAGPVAPSDVLLLENFDPNYLVFERAEALQRAGLAPRALVPIEAFGTSDTPNAVSRGIAEVMARQARLGAWQALPILQVEPISLNAAVQIRDHLARERVTSVIVVTPGFRSRRSALVYGAVLAGTRVQCVPVFGRRTPEDWADTWHGIQDVLQEFLKLQYYRFYVLPLRGR